MYVLLCYFGKTPDPKQLSYLPEITTVIRSTSTQRMSLYQWLTRACQTMLFWQYTIDYAAIDYLQDMGVLLDLGGNFNQHCALQFTYCFVFKKKPGPGLCVFANIPAARAVAITGEPGMISTLLMTLTSIEYVTQGSIPICISGCSTVSAESITTESIWLQSGSSNYVVLVNGGEHAV